MLRRLAVGVRQVVPKRSRFGLDNVGPCGPAAPLWGREAGLPLGLPLRLPGSGFSRGEKGLRWRSFAPGRPWAFSDCLVLEIARKAGHLPLATFDRALGSLDGAHRLQSRP
jgi:hypothetical protein